MPPDASRDPARDEPAETPAQIRRALWANASGKVESTLPDAYRDALGLVARQHVAVRPVLDHDAGGPLLGFDVATAATGDRATHQRLKHVARDRDGGEQTTLRFPTVLAAATTLTPHVRDHGDASLAYARSDADLTVRPDPVLRPYDHDLGLASDAGVAPTTKRLLELPEQYAVELDSAHVSRLGLSKGDPVAWFVIERDGQCALAADGDLARAGVDPDAAHVRRVQVHQSGVGDALSDQYRLYVPTVLVHALDLDYGKVELSVDPGRIVFSAAGPGGVDREESERTPTGASA